MASKVLFLDRLPAHWTEQQLRRALWPLGDVGKIVLLRRHNALYDGFDPRTLEITRNKCIQALVEAADVETAQRLVCELQQKPLVRDDGEEVTVEYSKNQELRDKSLSGCERHPYGQRGIDAVGTNRILLVTVQTPTYPVTTDFVYEIFGVYGVVEKVVIFVKAVGLQFALLEEAIEARKALNGLFVFPDCCSLAITFSKLPQELVVKENGPRTKDFLDSTLPQAACPDGVMTHLNTAVGCNVLSGEGNGSPRAIGAPTSPQLVGCGAASPVLLACNLRENVTCDNLFNLFSCYGNVVRIRKLNGKPDHALIQFSSAQASKSALLHLRGFTLLGKSLEIRFSRHSQLSKRSSGAPEVDTPWMKEYSHSLNRFTGKYANSTKHMHSPTKILHLSNFAPTATPEELKAHLEGFRGGEKAKVRLFSSPSGQPQALAEFPTPDTATTVLAQAHNSVLGERFLKVAFSTHSVH